MTILTDKHIVLGITGGIAAYKTPDLVRRLREQGAQVKVVMTDSAREFITPLTLQAVSGERVAHSLLDADAEAAMGHIELARWADLILIAPATADCIARLTYGHADDLLTTLCLATAAPIALAPAMNQQMWRAAITQQNCQQLRARGVLLLGPAEGAQACGDVGAGRMLEPLQIVAAVAQQFAEPVLAGLQVLISAGPTREALDPVRFISNRSSGKMGYAIAAAAQAAGAQVQLVSGPVNLPIPHGVACRQVESAQQMYEACLAAVADTHIFIATAAVADYRPVQVADQKIKKNQSEMQIALVRNPDILAAIAATQQVFTVGFAAETQAVEQYARDKLQRKGLDMIAANLVGEQLAFDQDDNALLVLWATGQQSFPQTSKTVLAQQLVALIAQRYAERVQVKLC